MREGSEATVSAIYKPTANGFNGTMTVLSVGMFRQPLSDVILNSPQIHFEQKNLKDYRPPRDFSSAAEFTHDVVP